MDDLQNHFYLKTTLFNERGNRPPLLWRGVRGEAKTWFWDIRFYIGIFFLLRLWGITNPPLDGNHGWRQSQTCMVARNLVEVENNPFYPRADQFGGDKTGIFGSEFPFFQELIAGVSAVFGYDHWYGRLINLIVTSFGIYFFLPLVVDVDAPEDGLLFSFAFIVVVVVYVRTQNHARYI